MHMNIYMQAYIYLIHVLNIRFFTEYKRSLNFYTIFNDNEYVSQEENYIYMWFIHWQ